MSRRDFRQSGWGDPAPPVPSRDGRADGRATRAERIVGASLRRSEDRRADARCGEFGPPQPAGTAVRHLTAARVGRGDGTPTGVPRDNNHFDGSGMRLSSTRTRPRATHTHESSRAGERAVSSLARSGKAGLARPIDRLTRWPSLLRTSTLWPVFDVPRGAGRTHWHARRRVSGKPSVARPRDISRPAGFARLPITFTELYPPRA